MGVIAGFAPSGCSYYRIGHRHDPNPNASMPKPFVEQITEQTNERWADELQLFHNPRALHPIPREVLQGVAHNYFEDGEQYTMGPYGRILGSLTQVFRTAKPGELKEDEITTE